MEPLAIWYNVLINPNYVRVFEHNGELVWTDGRILARVPPPLVDDVEAGKVYKVTPDELVVVTNKFNEEPIKRGLERAHSNCRVKLDTEGALTAPSEEVLAYEKDGTRRAITIREYHVEKNGEPVYVDEKIHFVFSSSVKRGAKLLTDAKRTTVAAKIDGDIVAWGAVFRKSK